MTLQTWLSQDFKPVIAIVGPTASGKSELAQRVALSVDGEVVSADSMQVYRGMNIGTGKVAPKNRRVPHFGLDLIEPGEPYSVALFQKYARSCLIDIHSRGKRSIVCGGTGFYVRAVIDDYVFPAGEQVNNIVRERYLAFAEENGAEALWELLHKRDSASAALIPANDVKRLVRALELLENGLTYAQQKKKLSNIPQLVPAVIIGLSVNPEVLRQRIDSRVDMMFETGFVAEVEILLSRGFKDGITSSQAIGYKEIVRALDGLISLDQAREEIKVATHRYAKRQRTWFRKEKRIQWVDANTLAFEDITTQALEIIAKHDSLYKECAYD